jgi:hypothetical protein
MHVAERLSRRIKAGDYHLRPLPAERELAEEVGVSHATARKAVQVLVNEGLLCRLDNGRLAVPASDTAEQPVLSQIALLMPAWESNESLRWQIALTQLSSRMKCSVRTVHYAHWDDPVLQTSLERFDGAFFMPVPEAMPSAFVPTLIERKKPVVVLGRDWSEYGVPSVRLFPPLVVQKLCDHLESLGHSNIACFNVQPLDSIIGSYIQQWQLWSAAHSNRGELIDEPVKPYTETLSAAYQVADRRIREGKLDCTAILCTQERVAAGAMRAMADHGIQPGRDIAVCTIDGAGRAEYCIPTLTSLETPDPLPYLAVCLEWMLTGEGRQWKGPLTVQPESVALAVRQSTVVDIDAKKRPARAMLVG